MTSPRALLRGWDRFWFAPSSARPLGAFRILFGLIALMNLALLAGDIDTWFTDAGRLRGSELRELAGASWSERVAVPIRWSPLQTYRDPMTVRAAFAATAAAAVAFTLGWHTKIASILLYAGMLSIHHANFLTISGADVLLMIVCFLMMLSSCGAAYSLDAKRRARKFGGPYSALIAPWPQRLIAIQVSVLYFKTALLKAEGPTWADGTALHYILNNVEIRRLTLGLTAYPAALNALTFGTVILEFALAFLLWVRAARPFIILCGLALHGGILLTINIPVFGELITACYLCFLTPSEWDSLTRALDPRKLLGRRRDRAAIPGRVDPAHAGSAGPHGTIAEIGANSRASVLSSGRQ